MSEKNIATDLVTSDYEANRRFELWKSTDPYPHIDTALLNSADILAYAKATSLIFPFDPVKLKGASYDVAIEGDVVYWDENGKKQIVSLKNDGDSFILYPNSIAFVTLQPTFRIPDYLALRFNLKITHIYKGLLLGTGPLVDPGFVGKLSIPLHNLTSNKYRFFKGDELITMEFTKMSSNKRWCNTNLELGHSENYIANEIKANRNVADYIHKALKNDRLDSVISSIPSAMAESEKKVQKAQDAVKAIEKKATIQYVISIIAVCTLVISAISLSINAINKANDRYDALKDEYAHLQQEYEDKINTFESQIDSLEELIESAVTQEDINNSSNSP